MLGSIEWTGGSQVIAKNQAGHSLNLDWDDGPSPVQLVLLAVGTCSLADVITGLKERKVTNASIEMEGVRRDEVPRIFTSMHMIYNIEGDAPERLVKGLIEKSHEKYCTVSNMLLESIKITTELRLTPAKS